MASPAMTQARLHLLDNGTDYAVICEGRILLFRSRDPETDTARALAAMNRRGVVTMFDSKTRQARSIVSIAKAAKVTAVEADHGPRFIKYRPRQSVLEAASSPEDTSPGTDDPNLPSLPDEAT
jgi:hypothetical protein